MAFKIELKPHIGKQQSAIGVVDIEHPQCLVMVEGKMVGLYCGKIKEPNKFLSFTVSLPDKVQAEIAAEVGKLTGGVSKFAAMPPEEHEVVNDDE